VDAVRYLRQILLAEIGAPGQERIGAATAQVKGPTAAHAVAELYARRAGFGCLADAPATVEPGATDEVVRTPAARDVLAGARMALAEMRRAAGMEEAR
jgi:hypothetical protein